MRISIIIIGALFLSFNLSAQLGLTGSYRLNEAPDWAYSAANTDDNSPLGNGWSVGVDYWIPLGQTRVDFLPELNVGQSVQTLSILGSEPFEFTQRAYSLFLNTNIYLLDLEGDCDCPTFSKSGDVFQKGFFLQISPGVSYAQRTTKRVSEAGTIFEEGTLAYSIGIGAGLDLGLSDIFTLTPMAGFRYYLPSEWDSLDKAFLATGLESFPERESSIRQLWAGLRLGIRLDQR